MCLAQQVPEFLLCSLLCFLVYPELDLFHFLVWFTQKAPEEICFNCSLELREQLGRLNPVLSFLKDGRRNVRQVFFNQCPSLGSILIKKNCSFWLLDYNSTSCQHFFFLTWYILTFPFRSMSNSVHGRMFMCPDNTIMYTNGRRLIMWHMSNKILF